MKVSKCLFSITITVSFEYQLWCAEHLWYMLLFSHHVMSDSLRPYGLQPTKLLCLWNSPGKNTGVGSHFLLQGIVPARD